MPTSVRLAPEIDERLTRLAQSTGRPKAFYIKEAIGSALDRLEYEYGLLQDAQEYRSGKMKTHTLTEVGESLGLDG